jgi:arylsulfatase A-like enzyme
MIDLFLLVTIDCFRADAFRSDVMPRLTSLARMGLQLHRMYAAGSRTIMSLPLLMRGSERAPPLPTRLAAASIPATALFAYADPVLEEKVLAGFTDVETPGRAVRWDARQTTNLALARIHQMGLAPHFLWVHYFDAHYPLYLPVDRQPLPPPPGLPKNFGTYLADLAYVDAELGRLVDGLAEEGRLPRTAILVTGDHGEGFGAHEVILHGISAYEMLVHVPGVFVAPELMPGHYNGLVSHRDIPATVLGAFGVLAPGSSVEEFGRSWLRVRSARGPLHRFVVSRSARAASGEEYSLPMAALVEGNYKLIETFEDKLVELYDPIDDPDELRDLAAIDPEHVAELVDHLEMFRDVDGFP